MTHSNRSVPTAQDVAPKDPIEESVDLCVRANQLIESIVEKKENVEMQDDNDQVPVEDDDDEEDNEDSIVERATNLFKRALELNDECIQAYLGLAYISGTKHDFTKAEELLNKAESIEPENESIKAMMELIRENKEQLDLHTLSISENNDDLEGVLPTGTNIDIPYLVKEGSVTKRFLFVLREIFDRFDENKDQSLNKREFNLFSNAVNGKDIEQEFIDFVFKNFDSNKKGLKFPGFIDFYVSQTLQDPTETISDLGKLGYNETLIKIPKDK
eukprot:gene4078-5104_t